MIRHSSCFLKFNLTFAVSERNTHAQLSTALPLATRQLTARVVHLLKEDFQASHCFCQRHTFRQRTL